jgi:hypothetical protein
VALSMFIYMGFNFLATPPPTSFNTIFGKTKFLTVFLNMIHRPIILITTFSYLLLASRAHLLPSVTCTTFMCHSACTFWASSEVGVNKAPFSPQEKKKSA